MRPLVRSGRTVYVAKRQPPRYTISGQTLDANSSALGGCDVRVYETGSGLLRAASVSDASGNYSLEVTGGQGLKFFVVAYKAGGPDVVGTTVNTLVGV